MMPKNIQQPISIKNSVPTKVKMASFLLKISVWAIIAASVSTVALGMFEFIIPIATLVHFSLVLACTVLVGIPLGIHEFHSTMKQANDLITEKIEVEKKLENLLRNTPESMEDLIKASANNVTIEKRFVQFSATQIFFGSAAALGSYLITFGNEVKAYGFPSTEPTTPMIMAYLLPGIGFTLLLAYGYRKSDLIVTSWENNTASSVETTKNKITQVLAAFATGRYGIFLNPPSITSRNANSQDVLNVNSTDYNSFTP